jgi:hypothetical protein
MTNETTILQTRRELINAVDASSAALSAYARPHKNEMGLVSDDIRQSDTYKALATEYNRNKAIMSQFYKMYPVKKYNKLFRDDTLRHFGRIS